MLRAVSSYEVPDLGLCYITYQDSMDEEMLQSRMTDQYDRHILYEPMTSYAIPIRLQLRFAS